MLIAAVVFMLRRWRE